MAKITLEGFEKALKNDQHLEDYVRKTLAEGVIKSGIRSLIPFGNIDILFIRSIKNATSFSEILFYSALLFSKYATLSTILAYTTWNFVNYLTK